MTSTTLPISTPQLSPSVNSQTFDFDNFFNANLALSEFFDNLAFNFLEATVNNGWGTNEQSAKICLKAVHTFAHSLQQFFYNSDITVSAQEVLNAVKARFSTSVLQKLQSPESYSKQTVVWQILEDEMSSALSSVDRAVTQSLWNNGSVSDMGFTKSELNVYGSANLFDQSEHPVQGILLVAGGIAAATVYPPSMYLMAVGGVGNAAISYESASIDADVAKISGNLGDSYQAQVDQAKAVSGGVLAATPVAIKFAGAVLPKQPPTGLTVSTRSVATHAHPALTAQPKVVVAVLADGTEVISSGSVASRSASLFTHPVAEISTAVPATTVVMQPQPTPVATVAAPKITTPTPATTPKTTLHTPAVETPTVDATTSVATKVLSPRDLAVDALLNPPVNLESTSLVLVGRTTPMTPNTVAPATPISVAANQMALPNPWSVFWLQPNPDVDVLPTDDDQFPRDGFLGRDGGEAALGASVAFSGLRLPPFDADDPKMSLSDTSDLACEIIDNEFAKAPSSETMKALLAGLNSEDQNEVAYCAIALSIAYHQRGVTLQDQIEHALRALLERAKWNEFLVGIAVAALSTILGDSFIPDEFATPDYILAMTKLLSSENEIFAQFPTTLLHDYFIFTCEKLKPHSINRLQEIVTPRLIYSLADALTASSTGLHTASVVILKLSEKAPQLLVAAGAAALIDSLATVIEINAPEQYNQVVYCLKALVNLLEAEPAIMTYKARRVLQLVVSENYTPPDNMQSTLPRVRVLLETFIQKELNAKTQISSILSSGFEGVTFTHLHWVEGAAGEIPTLEILSGITAAEVLAFYNAITQLGLAKSTLWQIRVTSDVVAEIRQSCRAALNTYDLALYAEFIALPRTVEGATNPTEAATTVLDSLVQRSQDSANLNESAIYLLQTHSDSQTVANQINRTIHDLNGVFGLRWWVFDEAKMAIAKGETIETVVSRLTEKYLGDPLTGRSDGIDHINNAVTLNTLLTCTQFGVTFNKDGFRQVYMNLEAAADLEDVLTNLVSNAARYSRASVPVSERTVTVRTTLLTDGSLVVDVTDNGMGFLPDSLSRIGQMGFREARREVVGSSGRGLSSVVDLLARNSWSQLFIRSTIDVGTTFRFVIPREQFVNDPFEYLQTGDANISSQNRAQTIAQWLRDGFVAINSTSD